LDFGVSDRQSPLPTHNPRNANRYDQSNRMCLKLRLNGREHMRRTVQECQENSMTNPAKRTTKPLRSKLDSRRVRDGLAPSDQNLSSLGARILALEVGIYEIRREADELRARQRDMALRQAAIYLDLGCPEEAAEVMAEFETPEDSAPAE
jgi:hypothetical protein